MPEHGLEDNTGQRSDPDKQFGCSPSTREGSKFISAEAVLLTLLLFTNRDAAFSSKRSCTGVPRRLNSLLYDLVQTTIPEQRSGLQ